MPALLPPIKLDFLTSLGDDLAVIFRQNRHPVFNAAGQTVGSYDTLDALCQGQWFLDRGAVQPPASQLYVLNFWGQKVPLATQCTRSAVANADGADSITFPQVVQPASAVIAQQTANDSAIGDPAPVNLQDLQGPSLDQAAAQQYGTYALWGVVGLLGLTLLVGGRDSGNRRR